MRHAFILFTLSVAFGVAAEQSARPDDARPAASPPVPLVEGALPNGLRYTVLPHRRELGRVSVRLVVLAGSLDERDDERGYAHFIEHMAFNGTRHHPPGTLIQLFQRLGVAFGPDLCANTYFTHTTYKLDLPAGRTAQLGEALAVLRDFADGIEFAPAEVQREKGVVLSELSARHTDELQVDTQRLRALYGGTLLPERHPTGDPGAIERVTAEALRGYYRRCYQPARLRLTIVGDVDPAAARKLLEDHFASLRGAAPAVAQVLPTVPPRPALQAHFIASATAPAAGVALTVVAPAAADTHAGFEAELANATVVHALDRRLLERRARAADRFGGAGANVGDGPDDRLLHYTVWATASTDDWEAAVGLVENEVRRARQGGFTVAELREATASLLASTRANVDQFAGELVDEVAGRIADAHAAGREWRHPAAGLDLAEAFLAGFAEAGATEAIRTLLPEDRWQLILTQRVPPPGGSNAVLAAYRASASRPLEPVAPAPTVSLEFRYGDFGPPGQVAQRRTDKDLGVELVRFANGVRLNLRPSSTEPNRFRLTARLGRGVVDLPRHQPGLPHLAAHLIGECDLGRHTREEVTRLLGLRAVSAYGTYSDYQGAVEMEGPARELPFALQLLTARLADVKLERSRLQPALSGYGACRASHLEDGASRAAVETTVHMANGDSRLREPPPEEVGQYSFTEIVAWMRSHWLDGPIEIGVVGDFDANTIVGTAAACLGTLPPRRVLPSGAEDRLVLREQASQEIRREPLADQAAAVQLSWAAPAMTDIRRRRALSLACDVLVDRLHNKLRQELGATYSPTGGWFQVSRQRDFGYAGVALTFEPARATEYARRAIAMADELAREGVTPEEFDRLRAPLITQATEWLRSNEWWLDAVLAHAQSEPAVLDDARTLAAVYSDLTRDEVSRMAADSFRAAAANMIIIMPVAAAADDPAADPAAALSRRAVVKINRGDFAGAVADFTQAIALNPKDDEAYVNRGLAKSNQGDTDGALADWDQAIALDPKNAMAYTNRAGLKIHRGDADGAMADATKAIEFDPLLSLAYSNRGSARSIKGDFDGCIADTTKAIELDSKNSGAYANRGAARANKGDWAGAMADATKAIELNPNDYDAYHNRGYTKQSKGDLDGAMADYTSAIALNPKTKNSHRWRASIKLDRGDLEGAIADYNQAIELNPADYEAYNNRGFAKASKGDLAGAIADYDRAIELKPDFAMAYGNRGNAKKARGDTFGAMDDLDRNLKLAAPPTSPPALEPPPPLPRARPKATPVPRADTAISPEAAALALVRSGDAKRAKRDYTGALADYDKAIELDPRLATAYCGRGYVHEARNNPTAAFAAFDMAVTLKPDYALAYNARGYARQAKGDFDRAILDYNEAIKRSESFAPAYFNRGYARQVKGDLAGALADYNKAIELSPKYTSVHSNRANIRHATGDFEGALADYDQAITVAKDGAHYPRLYRWVVQRRLQRGDPNSELATVIQTWSTSWTKTIGRFLIGELSEAEFLAAAGEGTGRTPLSRPCEANYFAGALRLVNGEPTRARELLEQCVATNQVRFSAFLLARAELARLSGEPAAPQRP